MIPTLARHQKMSYRCLFTLVIGAAYRDRTDPSGARPGWPRRFTLRSLRALRCGLRAAMPIIGPLPESRFGWPSGPLIGAAYRDRTDDILITNQVLYQLS